MKLTPEKIAELVRDFFPLSDSDAPLGNPINVAPNYVRIKDFARFLTELGDDYSERSIALIISTVRESFTEVEQNRLTNNYPLAPYGPKRTHPRTKKREKQDWDGFVSEIRGSLFEAIQPEKAAFLRHIADRSESDREFILGHFVRLFRQPITANQMLAELDLIERGERASCYGGCDDTGYEITLEQAELYNDGDGTFDEDEIIRVRMSFADFQTAMREWAKSLAEI